MPIIIMKFGVVLKECLSSSNSSVRNFSEITGINRGWIYNIFNGKKSLPQERFLKILSTYPFTKNQKKDLVMSYYSDMYGEKNFQKIQYIISSLNNFTKNPKDNRLLKPTKKYTMQSESLNDTKSIIDATIYLLNGIIHSENSFIYTNFSYGQEEINNLFYSYLSNYEKIEYYHLVNFDTTGIDIHNLRNIFVSMKYAALGYTTYYHYSNFSTPLQLDNIFPFFITTNRGFLVYDADIEKGFLLTDSYILKSFIEKNQALFSKATPLVTFYQNQNLLIRQFSKNRIFSNALTNISCYPIIPYFLDKNGYFETIYNSDEEKSFNDVFFYFQSLLLNNDTTILLNIDGFEKLSHKKMMPPLKDKFSKSDIKEILSMLKKQVKEKKVFFVDNRLVYIPEHINIIADNSSVLFLGITKTQLNYYIQLDNPIMSSDFDMFKDYIMKHKYYYDDTYVSHVLNHLESLLS